ncbi:hypothetical protein [Micromonospora sp. WMMD710]|uniref:hypothetical protein n=1 Tax=Micromonospora sp. WMMD710 TaxID=3016085 RepID=UPI002417A243|nr:hypothetical protein [Micromonospora sp. WMMD710]MDG4756296.1 hypothetical protein [Micromonospora sp. WMMD710]MDG4762439.1 hypothetical protein [Micromonospora sp. WMMD710]MDG4762474.1 hypothetical protein [Micromonospora sp. WMMD710]
MADQSNGIRIPIPTEDDLLSYGRPPCDHTTEQHRAVAATLVIRPGDTLIVALTGDLTMAEADEIRGALSAKLPGLENVVLITNATALAAYRPEDPPIP